MADPSRHDEARRQEAQAALDRVTAESETIGGTALGRAARGARGRARDHFAARDAVEPDGTIDPIELWGRRIGRALSLAGVIGLSIYLYLTYVR